MVWFVMVIFRGWVWMSSQDPSPERWIEEINQIRAKGCTCGRTYMPPAGSLTWNAQLAQVAQSHSQDMASARFFHHNSPKYGSPSDRLHQAGIEWQVWTENLFKAQGYRPSPHEVIQAWIKSPGHCQNLLNPHVTETGVGSWQGHYTQLLIRPKSSK